MTNRKLLNSELGRATVEEFKRKGKIPVAIVLDNVRSQHNIGSVFRSSDAFIAEKIVLCGISATPPTPEIHKSALGAEFSVEWEYFRETADAIKKLREEGYRIISIEQTENSVMLSRKLDLNTSLKLICISSVLFVYPNLRHAPYFENACCLAPFI